jgi:hypothetical protein
MVGNLNSTGEVKNIYGETTRSKIAQHSWNENHRIQWDNAKIIHKERKRMTTKLTESVFIAATECEIDEVQRGIPHGFYETWNVTELGKHKKRWSSIQRKGPAQSTGQTPKILCRPYQISETMDTTHHTGRPNINRRYYCASNTAQHEGIRISRK